MAVFTDNNRNMTLSTKVTINEKIELSRLAEKYGVTVSEFSYTILMTHKNQYEYIGRDNPEVDKLKEENRGLKRKNSRLETNLENADYKVSLEIERANKAIQELDEVKYQLKEALVDSIDLKDDNKNLSNELDNAKKTIDAQHKFNASDNYQKAWIALGGLFLALFGVRILMK